MRLKIKNPKEKISNEKISNEISRKLPKKVSMSGILLIALALLLAACSSNSSTKSSATSSVGGNSGNTTSAGTPYMANPSSSVSLTETGSTLLYPLFNIWIKDFQNQFSNIAVTTGGTGSGTGISEAASGVVNIGASDAYLSNSNTTQYPTLENIALAISAQEINYNIPGITGHLKLSGKILSAIYQGKITKWNNSQITALNPGVNLPNMTIVPVHRTDGSGDTFIFSTYLSKSDPSGWGTSVGYGTSVSWPTVSGAEGAEGNGGMVSTCKATPGCVAYIGISFNSQIQQAGLGEAQLENASGNFELPNPTTIGAEASSFISKTPANEAISLVFGPAPNGYPIINYEYAIVNTTQSSQSTAKAIQTLLNWAVSPKYGNSPVYLNQVEFQPLPASISKLSETLISKIGS